MAPSSAASERVFSFVKTMFGKDQITAMADFIQGSLMLRYNQRRVGRRISKLTSPHRRRQAFDPTFAAMHLTPAMVDDLMAIEPLAAHDLLDGLKQELPAYLSAAATCPALNAPTRARRSLPWGGQNWSTGRHAERHTSPRGSSTVHGYGPVDPGFADRWRNAQVSR